MGFREWFMSPVPGGAYEPVVSGAYMDPTVPRQPSSISHVRSDPGQLKQAGNYPGKVVVPSDGEFYGDRNPERPSYDSGPDGNPVRVLVDKTGPDFQYGHLRHDLTLAEDYGSVPGTVTGNYVDGPVTGMSMEVWQEGAFAVIPTRSIGVYGPVTGFPDADYAQSVSHAYFQQQFADYSTEAADVAMVSAI